MLDEILHSKKAELAETRLRIPLHDLMDQLPEEPPASFRAAITQPSIRIIAEIKYRSPSHGPFRCQRPPEEVGLATSRMERRPSPCLPKKATSTEI